MKKHEKHDFIVGVGVGCGLTARAAVRGGADFLAVYHTAIYRILGLPTMLSLLPYDDCNRMAMECLPQVLANAAGRPVFVGLGAHDPRRDLERMTAQAAEAGAAGVVNEPFSGAYAAGLRAALEREGLGFSRERELLRSALRRGLSALGWAFSVQEAAILAADGVPFVGIMADDALTEQAALCAYLAACAEQARRENPDVRVLIHGHPLEQLEVVRAAALETGVDGYFTGSAGERIPAERAVAEAVGAFKSIRGGESDE